jgi:DNA-binding NarL/FixJ family response regulator
VNFYLIIDNLFIQEGIKSILTDRFPGSDPEVIGSVEDLKSKTGVNRAVIITDNPSHIFNCLPQKKGMQARKNFRMVLIADNAQLEQLRGVDIEMVDALVYSNCSFSDIDEAIEHMLCGNRYRCGKLDDPVLTKGSIKEKLRSSQVSYRETEIIKMVINGKTSNEIADKLNISYHTVTTHRRNINKKLKVKTSQDLTRMFLNEGFWEN